LVDNSLRPISIGRCNWLHLGSKEAGPKIAAIFSIVESCRELIIPIGNYLADVLPGMADRSIQSLAQLTPTAYASNSAGWLIHAWLEPSKELEAQILTPAFRCAITFSVV
jgi:hypothetical protein